MRRSQISATSDSAPFDLTRLSSVNTYTEVDTRSSRFGSRSRVLDQSRSRCALRGQGEAWNSRQEVRNMRGLINHIYRIFRAGIRWRRLGHWIPKAAAALSERV